MDNAKAINELVDTAASYAGNLFNGLERTVNSLREDKVRTGLALFADAIEGIDWLTQSLSIVSTSGYDKFDIEPMKNYLSEMLEASENMDYVLLADLIEYEILPLIEDWGTRLDDILLNIGGGGEC
jgi:hypothetical protein